MHNVNLGTKAVEGLLKGVKLVSEPIRLSYGPKGCNVIIEDTRYPYHQIANDAQTIIQAIQSNDPLEKRGLGLCKELSDRADKESGDGRKTTVIIAETLLEEGFNSSLTPIFIKRDLDTYLPIIEKKIDELKTPISIEDIGKVARVAGESEEIGQVISEIYQKIGKDGIIEVEGSGTYNTSYKIIEGVRFVGTGFLSPAMVHDEEAKKENKRETRAVYENPTILVTKRKINSINDIDPLLKTLELHGKKDLVIFTDDMDANVAQMLVATHVAGVMNILIVKAPVLWKNYVFEDFAKVTGSTIVEDANGITFKSLSLTHLGTCGKIIVDKDECIIINGFDISEHIGALKNENTDDAKLRLSWLTTKTAILKLGANSESELSWKRLKTHDAINSSRLALIDGVVKGAGLTLFEIGQSYNDETSQILSKALQAPRLQLEKNGLDTDDVLDAAIVIKNAVRNAIGLAGIALTTQVVITLPEKTPEEIADEKLAKLRQF